MPVCLRGDESYDEKPQGVMALPEPAGRLGEIVRRLKRNHLAAAAEQIRADAARDARD